MAKKKDKKKKTDYKKKYKKLKVKYNKLKTNIEKKSKKVNVKKKVKEGKNTLVDHSLNYNVKDSVKRMRSLNNIEQVNTFIKGEKRLTVTRAAKGVLTRLSK